MDDIGDATGVLQVDLDELNDTADEESERDNHEENLKSQIEDELREMDPNEDSDEPSEDLHPVLAKVKEQVPSVFKLIQLVQSKIPKKNKEKKEKDSEDPSVENEEAEEGAPKKKTKVKVIHIVGLLIFGFLLFEDDILGTKEEPKEEKVTKVNEQKQKKDKVTPPIVEENKNDPLMIGAKEVEKVDTRPKEVVVEDQNQGEDITNLFKTEMNRNDEASDMPKIEPTITNDVIEVKEQPVKDIDLVAIKEQEMAGQRIKEDKRRKAESENIVNSKIKDDTSEDFLIDSFDMGDSGEDITKSIMEDLEKKVKVKKEEALIAKNNLKYDLLDVVNYDVPGRGLVYNCADKHWACVTVKSYSYCQSNYKFDQEDKKVIQCYPKAIYESDYDCESEQLLNVSNSADTSFCN